MDAGYRFFIQGFAGAMFKQPARLIATQTQFFAPTNVFSADFENGIGSQARVYLLVCAAALAVGILFLQRLISGTPIFPPKDYHSFTVFNKQNFLYLHDSDSLPSKAPIEKLEGERRAWAWIQLLCLTAVCIVDTILLVIGATQKRDFTEEAVGVAFWLLMLVLFAFRFYPTPYRPNIFTIVSIWSVLPLLLLCERDLWPKLLIHPSEDTVDSARYGWGVYTRLGLSLAIQACALFTPRQWYPADPYSDDPASPEQTASMFSYILGYNWVQFLVAIAWKRDIEENDLPPVPDYDRARLWSNKYGRHKTTSAFKTIFRLFRSDFTIMTLCSFLIGVLQFIWPVSMRELLAYIEGSKEPVINPWVWVAGLFLGPILCSTASQAYIFNATRLIIRVKAAFTQALLQKTLKLRLQDDSKEKKRPDDPKDTNPETSKSRVGMINNLMSSDLSQLTNAREFFMLVGTVPIEIILTLLFLHNLLGWSSLVGVALMVVTMIIPVLLARTLAGVQRRLRKATDARVGLMSETLNAIRIIKFFGLEEPFLGKIREKRNAELKLSITTAIYNLGFHTISSLLPVVNMIITFGLFTMVQKQPLTASIAFTSISLFDILRSQFVWMSFVSQQILYAFVSFERIDKFLADEEELDVTTPKLTIEPEEMAPSYNNAIMSWSVPGSEEDNGFRLNVNFECVKGGLTVVAGPVGSGKSSFLLGLLGEMRTIKGEYYLPRHGGIAFAAQSPWLQCDTVRQNIVFGSEFNQERYDKVVDACGLSTDFEKLEARDETEIGERGVTLSGGQKARLALARAVYSNANTVLLDDVLSALDAGTGKLVAERCIKGEVLAGRTVVLVTHHLSLVASAAKKIVLLADGQVVSDCGSQTLNQEDVMELLKDDSNPQNSLTKVPQLADLDIIDPTKSPTNGAVTPFNGKKPGKLIKDEATAKGTVPKRMIWDYMKNLGGPVIILGLIAFSVADQIGGLANQYFVGLWSDEYTNHPGDVNVEWWLGMYATVLMGTTVLDTLTYGVWYAFQWLAARRLHDNLVKSVLYSPIRFFDTTPIGRVINRLSNDVKSIDSSLGPYLQQFLHQCLEVVFRVFVMSGLIPAFLAPTLTVSVVGIVCGVLYSRAQIGVKRITSVKESPLMSHFGDTISGILTIRAFSCQERFLDENIKRIDDFSRPSEVFYNLNRWIGVRIGWCTALVGGAAGIIALTSEGYSPGLIGFSMTNALAFSSSVLMGVRYLNALEMELNSFERIDEWVKLPPESVSTPEKEPPASWPTQGNVEVRDLSVKYTADGPDVLHKITFDVKPSERIGVVGRTGAGKSSLALSLLGFTEISNGSITINGLNIQNVNLEALRRRVTIIPQDPVLFSGTIRNNLDPFGNIDDTDLQAALEGCGLAGIAQAGDTTPTSGTKRITLDTPITSGGENLSQGQRQLLAFARSIVRRSKLVILDEATSSTDMKTDERIRQTLKTNPSFIDSSLITIAHRLRTVMAFDRILVLDNKGNGGEVVEFDTPANLLANTEGILYGLAQKSGEFEELLMLATGEAE